MATNNDEFDHSDEQSVNYPQTAADQNHVVNVMFQAAGEAGSRITAVLLTYLVAAGVIEANQNPVGDISLSVPENPAVNLNASFADVDFQVTEELEVVLANNPALRDYIIDESLLTIIGGGAGKEWRRIRKWFDEYPALDEHLEAAVTADPVPHINLDIAGAVGATGAGHIRRHIERVREGDLPSPADHAGVYLPVTVGPALRLTDQWVQAIDPDHERRAFESLFEHRNTFRRARSEGVISGDIFADNALLSVLAHVHNDHVPLSHLRDLHVPIRENADWSNVIDDIQFTGNYEVNNAVANDALIRSLLPPLYAGIRPNGVHFDQGDCVFDRADLAGHLTGCTWLPGHLWLDNISDIASLVPDAGHPADAGEALYPAAKYASYAIPAGFDYDSTRRALVFIRAPGYDLDSQDHGLVRRTIAQELGIQAADVATVEIDGLESRHFPADNDPELALNVLVGVHEVTLPYQALGEQTL